MLIYAGIDEAGYGPFFGPLTVARFVLSIKDARPGQPAPDVWKLLSSAICRDLSDKKRRLPVNDSKKLHTASAGIAHIESAALAFLMASGMNFSDLGQWLAGVGTFGLDEYQSLPWYAQSADAPWQTLPSSADAGGLSISRSMLRIAMEKAGVQVVDAAVCPVLENRFNRMVHQTKSKASVSFTFVSHHLVSIWDRFGQHDPLVVVDRQSGRMHYRELLQFSFPAAKLAILREDEQTSSYRLTAANPDGQTVRQMTVEFQVESEAQHLPAAMASVIAKYTRELLMARFQDYFSKALPDIKPTAGYGADGKRFWKEISPQLAKLNIREDQIKRLQ
jgi:ribonuclease HII